MSTYSLLFIIQCTVSDMNHSADKLSIMDHRCLETLRRKLRVMDSDLAQVLSNNLFRLVMLSQFKPLSLSINIDAMRQDSLVNAEEPLTTAPASKCPSVSVSSSTWASLVIALPL